ncbi:hypothetical protein DNH61_05515 [Paenibacillus sambharensis]|uniref:Uncharacterized protein n=2 Tax=Paenibacillus sambharensis TaxID=1803190 RepID=A0A2W1LCU4_9BACL|nr:hypothetical protein DNH61_05515 [Paenibacillus sambharensis]
MLSAERFIKQEFRSAYQGEAAHDVQTTLADFVTDMKAKGFKLEDASLSIRQSKMNKSEYIVDCMFSRGADEVEPPIYHGMIVLRLERELLSWEMRSAEVFRYVERV